MACPVILTGASFLSSTLAHIDCQGQTIGAYGYGALADPGSEVSLALTGVLTIFIAILGLRLMLGRAMGGRDIIVEVIKVGLMLTLATSWPAWRIIGYDLVMDGPSEMARTIGLASGLPGSDGDMARRLQNVDDALVAMTMYGTGRLTGGVVGGSDLGDSFNGIALADQTGFGWGRIAFLTGTIGPYAVTRITAGLLLALAPLMAGLLLFGETLGLFMGWLRALAFCALGGLAVHMIVGVELAILSPWVTDVLAQRAAGTFTPSAPTELIVLAFAFALASFGVLLVTGWMVFHPRLVSVRADIHSERVHERMQTSNDRPPAATEGEVISLTAPTRAMAVAGAVSAAMRREEAIAVPAAGNEARTGEARRVGTDQVARSEDRAPPEILGSSFRRTRGRSSAAGSRRDRTA